MLQDVQYCEEEDLDLHSMVINECRSIRQTKHAIVILYYCATEYRLLVCLYFILRLQYIFKLGVPNWKRIILWQCVCVVIDHHGIKRFWAISPTSFGSTASDNSSNVLFNI